MVTLTGPADRVSIFIPARNEVCNLHEAFVVDDYSNDDTVKVAPRVRPYVKIVQHPRQGKGNVLARGAADVIVMLDADESADPGEIDVRVAKAAAPITKVNGGEQPRSNATGNLKAVPDRIQVLRTIMVDCHPFDRIGRDAVTNWPTPNATLVGEST